MEENEIIELGDISAEPKLTKEQRRWERIKADPKRYEKYLEKQRAKDQRRWQAIKGDPEKYAAYQQVQHKKDKTRWDAIKADPERYEKYHETQQIKEIRRALAKKRTSTKFIAIDGEGVYLDDSHRQHYVLLSASSGETLYNPKGLESATIIKWLLMLGTKYPDSKIVAFFFDYDVNFWLKDLTLYNIADIWSRNKCNARLEGQPYDIQYVPHKWVVIEKIGWQEVEQEDGSRRWEKIIKERVTITDVSGYFQCSFLTAIYEWQVASLRDMLFISEMKWQRAQFSLDQIPELTDYNQLECELLAALMAKLDQTLIGMGVKLNRWHGAGTIATAYMERCSVRDYRPLVNNPELDHAVMSAYFGGRAQVFKIGIFNKAYAYDMHSAYPWAMAQLPSLHGTWRHVTEYDPHAAWAVWRLSWYSPHSNVTPFPFRCMPEYSVFWLENGAGWYWSPEVSAAVNHGVFVEVKEGWVFDPQPPDTRPFSYMHTLYQQRLVAEQIDPAKSMVLKFGMNASYGKLCQSIGFNGKPPAYQSFVWAGLTTSIIRAKMYETAMQKPSAIISISTDGIWSTEPLELPISNRLGEWSYEEGKDLFVLSPVLFHCTKTDGEPKARNAGYHLDEMTEHWANLRAAWLEYGIRARYRILLSRFIGMGSAQAFNWWDYWLTWTYGAQAMHTISAQPQRGRATRTRGKIISLKPYRHADLGIPYHESPPYKLKTTGSLGEEGIDRELVAFYEQPDPS